MYWICLHAVPDRSQIACADGGAYVNCFIEESSEEEALDTARECITAEGWIVENIEFARRVTREDMVGGAHIEYFDQAVTDGAVFVFHKYPLDDAGTDVDEPEDE